jgi:hypothetical protein
VVTFQQGGVLRRDRDRDQRWTVSWLVILDLLPG